MLDLSSPLCYTALYKPGKARRLWGNQTLWGQTDRGERQDMRTDDREDLMWQEVSTEHMIRDEWIDFRRSAYRLPDGRVFEPFYTYSRRDYVVIVASDKEGNYLCVRQFRQGIGEVTTEFPTTHLLDKAKPVIKKLPGWKCEIRGIRKYEELPENCRKYIEFVEEQIGYPVTMVSNGPGREDIIYRARQ